MEISFHPCLPPRIQVERSPRIQHQYHRRSILTKPGCTEEMLRVTIFTDLGRGLPMISTLLQPKFITVCQGCRGSRLHLGDHDNYSCEQRSGTWSDLIAPGNHFRITSVRDFSRCGCIRRGKEAPETLPHPHHPPSHSRPSDPQV